MDKPRTPDGAGNASRPGDDDFDTWLTLVNVHVSAVTGGRGLADFAALDWRALHAADRELEHPDRVLDALAEADSLFGILRATAAPTNPDE